MSLNQSRLDRTESGQYRKPGRSNRNVTGGGSKASGTGSGGGATASPPSSSNNRNTSNPALSTNRSFKKNNNVQGGQQGRVVAASVPVVNSDSGPALRSLHNGAHVQQSSHGTSVPITTSTVKPAAVKPVEMATPKASRAPRAPASGVSAVNLETKSPTTPVGPTNGLVDGPIALQFGSFSPGCMNGVLVPPRTTSAPPNLDEQKRDQVPHGSLRTPAAPSTQSAPSLPVQSVPKQQLPKKETGMIDHSVSAEIQPTTKPKRDAQVPASSSVSQSQKQSVHSMPMPIQMSFHPQQVPVQFGGPNPPISAHAMSASTPMTMQMQMPLQNSTLAPQMFVPGFQTHPMQSQGMLHQGQSLPFTSHLGPPLTPQLGNTGMNLAQQFPQQQAGKYGSGRKTVKITHPETHEELRLDGSTATRSHSHMPQSHPVPSYSPAHTINYYTMPGTYNAGPIFLPTTASLSLNNSQPPSQQPPRHQVTVKPAATVNVEKDPASSVISPRDAKVESVKLSRPPQKDSQSPSHSSLQQLKLDFGQASSSSLLGQAKTGLVLAPASGQAQDPASLATATVSARDSSIASVSGEYSRHDAVGGPALGKTERTVDDRGEHTLRDEVGRHAAATLILPSQKEPEGALGKVTVNDVIQDVALEAVPAVVGAKSEASGLNHDQAEEHEAPELAKLSVGRHDEVNQPNHETLAKQEKAEIFSEPSLIDSSKISSVNAEGSFSKETSVSKVSKPQELLEPADENGKTAPLDVDARVEAETDSSLSSESRLPTVGVKEDIIVEPTVVDKESAPSSQTLADENFKSEDEYTNPANAAHKSSLSSDIKVKSLPESNVVKSSAPRGKKKRKELLKKYENAAPTSDLYLAYKGPEEKKDLVSSTELSDNVSSCLEPPPLQTSHSEVSNENAAQSKVEPDDWEDAAEIPTPKLEGSVSRQHMGSGEDGNGGTKKKYSRDFLLIFADHCADLPEGFEFPLDVAEALMVSNVHLSPELHEGPGRITDKPTSASRLDRRLSGIGDNDKWSKIPSQFAVGRDLRSDGPNMGVFWPNQSANYDVLRNPRMQNPLQYPAGILTGPMQSLHPQVVLPRNNSDSGRWLRGTAFQKGLMPSPHTPLQMMHKAENKYEVGKVSDEEEAKQRQLKAILNKLTPQNFDKLFEQVKQVNIDNVITLNGVISQIFDKALMEPTFCEMYANFCYHLAQKLPGLTVDNQRITFKRLLLNKCQEEFEKGEREEEEANKVDEEGAVKQTEQEREEKRLKARRRMLGNIRLIGELYKKRMLTERIMHECIKKLLGQYQNPDEEDVEALCKLMSTIGEMIDHPKAKEHMDAYFDMMAKLSNNMKLSSRVRFMLKDAIDLRKNKWQQRRKVEGPKKIEEVHRDAAQERQAQATRLARTPSMGSSLRRGQQMEFSPRGSMLTSPSSHLGGFRAVPPQLRGYAGQDARMDDRHVMDNRTFSVPLPQWPLGDDSITLGPQGGLARGMSFRGNPASPGIPSSDFGSTGDSRRMGIGLNGSDPIADRPAYSSREESLPKQMPERSSVYDQPSRDNRNTNNSFDNSLSSSSETRDNPQMSNYKVPSEKVWSDDRLRDMSMAAIKEFYSAKDENEVALCVKDLNNPNFHPNMVSLWVTDSFERKDMERDLLAKLLIYLSESQVAMISQSQLIKGFESVLVNLEDAVNDAPRAAEFLGLVFARLALENIVPFGEIGRMIYEGGEEPGRLVEIGLAAEVLGTVLEIISAEAGDSMLNEIRSNPKLRLENFRPPGSTKSGRLDKFI